MNSAKTLKDYEALFDEVADHFARAPLEEVERFLLETQDRKTHAVRAFIAQTYSTLPTCDDMQEVFLRAGRGAERWAVLRLGNHGARSRAHACTPATNQVPSSKQIQASNVAQAAALGRTKNRRLGKRASSRNRDT